MIALELKVPLTTIGKLNAWRHYKRNVPQKWNDLSRKQLIRISGLMNVDNQIDSNTKLILITAALMNIPKWMIPLFTPVQMVQLQWMTKFLFEDNTLTLQLIPFVRVGFKKLYGPPDALKYVKAKEFIQIEKHFAKYHKTGEIEHLDKMIACMYRPKGKMQTNDPKSNAFCGDIREEFSTNSVERRLKLVQRMSLPTKLAIANWFLGCWLAWQKIFKRVFTAKEKKREHFGWPETMLNMSGEKFGMIDQAMEHYMFDILLQMEIDMKHSEEFEEKYGR